MYNLKFKTSVLIGTPFINTSWTDAELTEISGLTIYVLLIEYSLLQNNQDK